MTNREITNLDNNPPSEIDLLKEKLAADYATILNEATQLEAKAKNILESNKEVADDSVSGIFSDMVKELTGSNKKLEAARVAEKTIFDAQANAVQSFFKLKQQSLDGVKTALTSPLNDYANKKMRMQQEAAAAAARAAREEAEKKLQAAAALQEIGMQHQSDAALIGAEMQVNKAERHETEAKASVADLSRTRGGSSVMSLRTNWKGRIDDRSSLDLDKLRHFFTDESLEKALNAYIKAGNREISGATIYQDAKVAIK